MPQTKPIVSIENVVASASVDQKIDLNDVTKKFPDTEYHPDQFPGLVFRLKIPRTATLIFRTGKMVCTGAKSERFHVQQRFFHPGDIRLETSIRRSNIPDLSLKKKTTRPGGSIYSILFNQVSIP